MDDHLLPPYSCNPYSVDHLRDPDPSLTELLLRWVQEDAPFDFADGLMPHLSVSEDQAPPQDSPAGSLAASLHDAAAEIQQQPLPTFGGLFLPTALPLTTVGQLIPRAQLADQRSWMSLVTHEARIEPATIRDELSAGSTSYPTAVDRSARDNLQASSLETKLIPPALEVASKGHVGEPYCEIDESRQAIQWARTHLCNLARSHDIPDTGNLIQPFGTPTSATCNKARTLDDSPFQEKDLQDSHGFGDPRRLARAKEKQAKEHNRSEDKTKEQLSRVKKPKKERGPKFYFRTKSDVEVIDDGFKWRKYGQKAVKHSQFPRSYYKCTTKQCPAKKHVERQADESSHVLITYEGLHNHATGPTPIHIVRAPISSISQGFSFFPAMEMELFLSPQSSDYISELEQIVQLREASDTKRDEGLLEDLIPGELRRQST